METNELGLVSYEQIAELLNVKPRTVRNYHSRAKLAGYPEGAGKFPAPTVVVFGHPQWTLEAIEEFQAGRTGPGWWDKGADRVPQYVRPTVAS